MTEEPQENPFVAFESRMQEKYASQFQAATELMRIADGLFNCPLTEPLHKVMRFVGRIVVNSYGAVIALALSGYGNDAMKIVRSIFEGTTNVAFLRLHPELVQDYIDFMFIKRWQLYQTFLKTDPDCAKRVPAASIDHMQRWMKNISHRFANKNGDLRNSWCKKSLRQMAKEVNWEYWYPIVYTRASSIVHVDMDAIVTQKKKDVYEIEIAPAELFVEDALKESFSFTFRLLGEFNEAANLGFEADIEKLGHSYISENARRKMVEGMLDILWENYGDPRATPRFRLIFINIRAESHGAKPHKTIVGEDALEDYLIMLGFTPKNAKDWIKQVKAETSVSIQNVTISEQYAAEYERRF